MSSSQAAKSRGLLIVLEGCDRSGKTTLSKRLVEDLNSNKMETEAMRFPDRTTLLGKFLDGYLRGENQLSDQAVHLLFSANRWEKVAEMEEKLAEGTNLVVDRYAYSGVAFSSAKDGMDLEWCKNPDRGLPEPDLICFMEVSPEEARKRGGFGQERYEKECFQIKVRRRYEQLMEQGNWTVVQTDGRTLDEVYAELLGVVQGRIQDSQGQKTGKKLLWVEEGGMSNGCH